MYYRLMYDVYLSDDTYFFRAFWLIAYLKNKEPKNFKFKFTTTLGSKVSGKTKVEVEGKREVEKLFLLCFLT